MKNDLRCVLNDGEAWTDLRGSCVMLLEEHRYPCDSIDAEWGNAWSDDEVEKFFLDSPTDLRALADKLEYLARTGSL